MLWDFVPYRTRAHQPRLALAAEVASDQQGRGISSLVVAAMADVACNAGLESLVAPVRPSWKTTTHWSRSTSTRRGFEDGLPFDPWMRVHVLRRADLRPQPRSLKISGSVAEWERWTGVEFPADGQHVFPGLLAALEVRGGVGHYWEPNIWVLHRIKSP